LHVESSWKVRSSGVPPEVPDISGGTPELQHKIFQRADGFDGYANHVAAYERERRWRHDAGARHQETAAGKTVVAEEVLDELLEAALDARNRRGLGEDTRS